MLAVGSAQSVHCCPPVQNGTRAPLPRRAHTCPSRRRWSCQIPSPLSSAPCSKGCSSGMSTGAWAAWAVGESCWARRVLWRCPWLWRGRRVSWHSTLNPRAQPTSLCRAQEVKEEPFFKGLDWQMVFLQKVRGAQGHGEDGYKERARGMSTGAQGRDKGHKGLLWGHKEGL